MRLYRHLYISDSLKRKGRQIAWKLKTNMFVPSIYIITLSEGTDLLDIYNSSLLMQPYYKKYSPFIVGFAKDQSEAIELVQKIIMDTLNSRGNLDVKSFILEGTK